MGFFPFVETKWAQGRSLRAAGAGWVFVISTAMLGSCTMGYALVGDWWYGVVVGMASGVAFSLWVTVQGLITPIDQLPPDP